MPLTEKGKKIKKAMVKTYGKEKANQVFNAMINEGKLHDVEKASPKKKKKKS